MGFRYYRRARMGKNWGLNFSKSGVSPSFRSKLGSIGTKGYSIRTGIKGLSYRGGFGKKNGAIAGLLFFLIFGIFIVAYYILKFILKSIFTKNSINYANLCILLGCILVILILVYYNLPDKVVDKVVASTQQPNIITSPHINKKHSHRILSIPTTDSNQADSDITVNKQGTDTLIKSNNLRVHIDSISQRKIEPVIQRKNSINNIDSMKLQTHLEGLSFINKYSDDNDGGFSQKLGQLVFDSNMEWSKAVSKASNINQNQKPKIQFQYIFGNAGNYITTVYQGIKYLPKEQQYNRLRELFGLITKLNSLKRNEANKIDKKLKKSNNQSLDLMNLLND